MHSRILSWSALAALVVAAAGMARAAGPPPLANSQAPPPSPEHTTLGEHFTWPLARLFPSDFRDLAFPLPDAFPDWVDDFETWVSSVDGQNVDFSGLDCSSPLILQHFSAYLAALADLEPLSDYALSSLVYYFNLGLKQCKPLAIAPQPREFELEEANDCELVIDDQRKHQDWNYIFFTFPPLPALSLEDGRTAGPATFGGTSPGTRIGIDPADTLWGPLGTPLFFHYNTAVKGFLSNVTSLSQGKVFQFDTDIDVASPRQRSIPLAVGSNDVTWKFSSLVGPLDLIFIYVPPAPPGTTGPSVWKAAGYFAQYGLPIVGLFLPTDVVAGTEVTLTQRVDVWDRIDPVISTSPAEFTFEGTIFGGTSIQVESYRQQMLDALEFSDACDNPTELVEPKPVLWPVDQTTPVTWTVLDPGPNDQSGRADRRNAASVVQMVTVVDTIAPILRAPVPLAREVPPGTTGPVAVSPDPPEAFDFVDATPQLVNDGPPGGLYPIGQTSITWTATDQSGNASQATQIVNVKEEGTNVPPVADARTGGSAVAAQSFAEVQVSLTGSDADSDPLSFRIVDPPDDGFFVAPLLPYFFGDSRAEEVTVSRCAADGRGEADLFDPEYVTTTDAGFTYVMNAARDCSDSSLFHRITVFDRDRNFVVARDMPRTGDFFKTFHLDERQGTISYTSNLNTVSKLDLLTLETIAEYQAPDSYAKKAIFDIRQGREVLYITGQDTQNRGKIDVYDVTGLDLLPGVPVLGPAELVASFDVGEGAPAGAQYNVLDMAIDSGGHFYASSLDRRIHKFEPFGVDASGDIVVGDEIGWLGSCLGGSDCDALNQVSRGYSCSFATCTVGGVLPSEGLGQLGALGGMAISPTDILYVAEFGNDRVQRFTPEGFYAGHARSTCGGDELCFVLGQFGKPNAVGVNSSNFFVLDRTLDVVHIFDTSVVELVGPNEGRVTYKSDSGFFGAVDSFQFVADDGFDQSAPATVEIDVQRGFNPALAKPNAFFQLDEDTPTQIRLDGLDPDFPLDPLVFEVTRQPEHGSLSPAPGGDSGDWVYTPDPDFHGDDSLDFRVDDGSGPSTPETLYLRVLPVNDDPVLGPGSGAAEAGRGYPYFFQFSFDDVEFDDGSHVATIDWGDGTVVGTCAPADPACDGARVLKLAQPGTVAASHIYTGFGLQQIEYCIRDEESSDLCNSFFVDVTSMADFASDIVNENTQVPVGGELSFDFVVSHQPTTGVAGPALIDDVLLVVEYDDGLDPVVASPPRGTCEFDQRPGLKATLCNIGPMAEGETLVIPVTYSVIGPAQEIRAEVQSSLPDPNGALARQPIELIDDDLARVAALGGSAEGGTLNVKVAGVALSVPMSPAESKESVAQALVDAVIGDSTLSGLGVTAEASGGLVELSEPIQSLVLDEGGIERGEPVPFRRGQMTLDLDSLGVFLTTLSQGTAWVDSAGDVSLPPGAIGAIDAAAMPAAGPPEIAALELSGATPGGGTLGSALPLYPLRLAGELRLDRSDSPVDAMLPLSVLGADDSTSTSEGSGSDFTLIGEPWSVDGFDSDGFVEGQGVTHTRSYQGADERDVLGNGPLQLVAPVTLEVFLDQSLVEVVPGGATLRLELVPEPAGAAGRLALLAALAGLRARRRSLLGRC